MYMRSLHNTYVASQEVQIWARCCKKKWCGMTEEGADTALGSVPDRFKVYFH